MSATLSGCAVRSKSHQSVYQIVTDKSDRTSAPL